MLYPGLVSVSFRALKPDQIIALCTGNNLLGIEWGGDIHVPTGELGIARRVGEATRAAGLQIAAYGSYHRLGLPPGETPEIERVIETAALLGAPVLRVWAGNAGSHSATDAHFATVAEAACHAADLAAKADIRLALELHNNTLTDTEAAATRLLDLARHPNLDTLWQPYNGATVDACLATLKTVSPRLRNLHVFHWVIAPDGGMDRRPLAEGQARWMAYLDHAAHLPGDRWCLLEFVRGDAPDALAEDAATLRRWLATVQQTHASRCAEPHPFLRAEHPGVFA